MTTRPPTNSGAEVASAANATPKLVPETWPPADPIEPVEARRIHWLLAIPFAIPAVLFPKRFGPHAAAASWAAAYVVHFFWVLTAFGALLAFTMENQFGLADNADAASLFLVNPLVELQRAWAGVVMYFFSVLTSWGDVFITAIVVVMLELLIWAAGLVLAPFRTAGEGALRTYLRSVKLLLWASALPAVGAWILPRALAALRLLNDDSISVSLVLCGFWQLFVILRLGARYAGPREGPRWRNRQPRCDGCGYSIVSLPLDGRCPECGKPVAESLPERRRPPAFAAERGWRRYLLAFPRTTLAALRPRAFSRNLAVWGDLDAARRYALTVCGVIGAIVAMTLSLVAFAVRVPLWGSGVGFDEVWRFLVLPASMGGTVAFLAALAWVLIGGLFVTRFGFRDAADRIVVLCFSSASLFAPLLLGIVGGLLVFATNEIWHVRGEFYIEHVGTITLEAVVDMLCMAPAFVALILSFLQLRDMLRGVRYANA